MIVLTRCKCGVAFVSKNKWLDHVAELPKDQWSNHAEVLFDTKPPTYVNQNLHNILLKRTPCPAGCETEEHEASPEPPKTVIQKIIKGLWHKPEIKLEKV